MTQAHVLPTDPAESADRLREILAPGGYRWAIYDRPARTLWFGPAEIHTHMGVAEDSRVLRHPASYYRPGGNVLGGFVCRSLDGDFYFDPFSGTFPGTDEGVREAEHALAEVATALGLPLARYDDVPQERRALGRGP